MKLEEIKEIIEKNNLIFLGKEKCKNSFNNWKKEEIKQYKKIFKKNSEKNISFNFDKIYLEIQDYPKFNYCFIVLRFLIKIDKKYIGYYKIYYNLNREIEDDIFVIY